MSRASSSSLVGGSRRSGRLLISTATSCSTQASKTAFASKVLPGRVPRLPVTSRPVQWPSTFIRGLRDRGRSSAGSSSRASIFSLECTLATRTSSRASSSSVWSSAPSSRMSTSIPLSRVNPLPAPLLSGASLTASTTPSWRVSRSGLRPWATVSRGEWSVSTRYSWPSSIAVNAISSIGEPPSDQSEWECRSPRSCDAQLAPARRRAGRRAPSRASPAARVRRRARRRRSPWRCWRRRRAGR